MIDKFKHAIQNMRDIIHFQEIEKLTELEFSELVTSHDSPTAKRIEQLERELAEMDSKNSLLWQSIQAGSKEQTRLKNELAEAREKYCQAMNDYETAVLREHKMQEQRDMLAKALEMVTTHNPVDNQCDNGYSPRYVAKQALAAVKGDSND